VLNFIYFSSGKEIEQKKFVPVSTSPNLSEEVSGHASVNTAGERRPRKPRKKKSYAKSFSRKKKCGKYKAKASGSNPKDLLKIGLGDKDLAECLFSDDEVRIFVLLL